MNYADDMMKHPADTFVQTVDIHTLLLQQEPFVMVGSLRHFDMKRTVTATTVTPGTLFLDSGELTPFGMMENVAQTCAARIGYINKYILHREVSAGVLAAIKRMEVKALPAVGDTIITTVDVVEEVFDMILIRATVNRGEQVMMTAELKMCR